MRFYALQSLSAHRNHESEAAVLQMLSKLAEGDTSYVPTPPFAVIDGGKDGRSAN